MRRLRLAGSVFAAWSVYGFLLGQQVYALRSGDTLTWRHALAFELAYCYSWAALTPLVLWLQRVLPVDGLHWKRSVPAHLVAGVVFAAAAQTGENLILIALHVTWYPLPTLAMLIRSMVSNLDYGFVLYTVLLLIAQTFASLRQHHLDLLLKADLHSQLAEAQLKALRMQMHPHFLFNVLNSVSELIHSDPKGAERLVVRLSELLRIFLQSSETAEMCLEKEVDFLRRYLEIQKIRFQERLIVEITVDPRTLNASVPSFLLQPLVENAILHGIAERDDAGVIAIEACLDNGRVRLQVADNGSGYGRKFAPEGTGLRNTRRRLETRYGENFEFSVQRLARGGVRASIAIPYQPASQGDACNL